jgi:hypothetical protein
LLIRQHQQPSEPPILPTCSDQPPGLLIAGHAATSFELQYPVRTLSHGSHYALTLPIQISK